MSSSAKRSTSYQRIWSAVGKIPKGNVATYGQIARISNLPRQARLVGYALHNLPHGIDVPWQRVINSKGKISYAATRHEHDSLQQKILEQEGILFSNNGKIDLEKYRWSPKLVNK